MAAVATQSRLAVTPGVPLLHGVGAEIRKARPDSSGAGSWLLPAPSATAPPWVGLRVGLPSGRIWVETKLEQPQSVVGVLPEVPQQARIKQAHADRLLSRPAAGREGRRLGDRIDHDGRERLGHVL